MLLRGKKSIDYDKFFKIAQLPTNKKSANKIEAWIKENASHPDFDVNKLIFRQQYESVSMLDDIEPLKIHSDHFLFLPYLAKLAATDFAKDLFLKMLDLIPTEKLKQCKELVHYAVCNHFFAKDFFLKCLEKNLALDIEMKDGSRPAHFAAMAGQTEVLKALDEYKVDIFSAGKQTHTPAELAYIGQHKETIHFFESRGQILNYNKICATFARFGKLEKIEELLKSVEIDFNAKIDDELGITILMKAITTNKLNVAEYLISQKKGNLAVCNNNGLNAADYAALKNQPKLLQLILKENPTIELHPLSLVRVFANGLNHCVTIALLVDKLKENKSMETLNAIHPETGLTPLHYAICEATPNVYIDKLLSTNMIDVNKKSQKPPSLTPLEFAVAAKKNTAVEKLINVPGIEKNEGRLIQITLQNDANDAFVTLVEKGVITDFSQFFQVFIPKDLLNPAKILMLKHVLTKLPEDVLREDLVDLLGNALTLKAIDAVNMLSEYVSKKTLSKDNCDQLRVVLKKCPAKELTWKLDQIYPPIKQKNKAYSAAEIDPSAIAEEKQKRDAILKSLKLADLESAKQNYQHQYNLLKTQLQAIEGDSVIAETRAASEEKMHEIRKDYDDLLQKIDLPIEDQRDKTLALTERLKKLQSHLQMKSHTLLRTHPTKWQQPKTEEKENEEIKPKEKKPPKEAKTTIKLTLPPTTVTPQKKKKKKKHKPKDVQLPPEILQKNQNINDNVQLVISHYQAFTTQLGIKVKNKMDEKEVAKNLEMKLTSFKDKMAIKYYLESLLIELALNQPMGLGKHSKKEFRNTNLYKTFNDDNLRYRAMQEPLSPEDNKSVMQNIARLWIALGEYTNCFNAETGDPIKEFTTNATLLGKLSEQAHDERKIFPDQLFEQGRCQAHKEYHHNYEELVASAIFDECKLLNDSQKNFVYTYLYLRQISEAQKANLLVSQPDRDLANNWRHPTAKNRTMITEELLKDANFAKATNQRFSR